jgi:hypothetical protein
LSVATASVAIETDLLSTSAYSHPNPAQLVGSGIKSEASA